MKNTVAYQAEPNELVHDNCTSIAALKNTTSNAWTN